MGTARYSLGGSGLQTAALAFGGSPGGLTNTEEYDGTSWTTTTSMATGRSGLGSANSSPSTAALAFGGNTTAVTAATEEFTGAFNATRTLTTST
jgi:hypothetical protein